MAYTTQTNWHSFDHEANYYPPLTGNQSPPDELASAAEALRETELDAVCDDDTQLEEEGACSRPLEDLSIDELRVLANALDIPNRSSMTESAMLIAEIRCRLLWDETWDRFPNLPREQVNFSLNSIRHKQGETR